MARIRRVEVSRLQHRPAGTITSYGDLLLSWFPPDQFKLKYYNAAGREVHTGVMGLAEERSAARTSAAKQWLEQVSCNNGVVRGRTADRTKFLARYLHVGIVGFVVCADQCSKRPRDIEAKPAAATRPEFWLHASTDQAKGLPLHFL